MIKDLLLQSPKIYTTSSGLIHINHTIIHSIFKINYTLQLSEIAEPIVVNVDQIAFVSHNIKGFVTLFLANSYEISINTDFEKIEEVVKAAKDRRNIEIL